MVCVSRSRLGHGGLTQFCINFLRYRPFRSGKIYTELGQAPTPQARPRDIDHVRPSRLAARALRSVEHTPSKFGHDLHPVRRGLVAAVKCCVRKACLLRCPGRLLWKQKRSQSLVWWVSTPQWGNLFCFLFSDPVGLRQDENQNTKSRLNQGT